MLERPRRLVAAEIVKAWPGMGIVDPDCPVLALQIAHQPAEQRVLDDVGKIAGMEGMAIVQCSDPLDPIRSFVSPDRLFPANTTFIALSVLLRRTKWRANG
ncbi:hypothetical protein [Jiella pelagia]|uniref:Uncharacterized protein n=1 Tax=Jiella pelagia TaxID=2986949 RepID=A0ABY7C2C4_9HYPH|nr:hypothetical protein [Jiella pelagia]WAP70014.1 hypothetical protein OH818_07620 [Jiella pelagia]